ncbi:MAG: hypothetical protein ACRDQ2_17305, partial [Gaiellales bacterium]
LQRRPLQRPMDYLLHAFTLARSQRLQIESKLFAEKVNLVMLPVVPLDFFVPFASMEHTGKLMELAYQHTKAFLAGETPAVTEQLSGTLEAIAPAK